MKYFIYELPESDHLAHENIIFDAVCNILFDLGLHPYEFECKNFHATRVSIFMLPIPDSLVSRAEARLSNLLNVDIHLQEPTRVTNITH
jgi:hypothetical protein